MSLGRSATNDVATLPVPTNSRNIQAAAPRPHFAGAPFAPPIKKMELKFSVDLTPPSSSPPPQLDATRESPSPTPTGRGGFDVTDYQLLDEESAMQLATEESMAQANAAASERRGSPGPRSIAGRGE